MMSFAITDVYYSLSQPSHSFYVSVVYGNMRCKYS